MVPSGRCGTKRKGGADLESSKQIFNFSLMLIEKAEEIKMDERDERRREQSIEGGREEKSSWKELASAQIDL
jgi:hypothetical protein